MEFEGTLSGDSECWCLEVAPEEYKRVCGEEAYQTELDYRNQITKDGFPDLASKVWRVYPDDIFRALGCGNIPTGKVKFRVDLIKHDQKGQKE